MAFLRRLGSLIVGFVVILAMVTVLSVAVVVGYEGFRAYRAKTDDPTRWQELSHRGDFVGGHLGTILSASALAIVILTTFIQQRGARMTDARAMFASGMDAIARYDTHKPGCTQALRLLNYYCGIALRFDRAEFYSLLNAVMTSEIRRVLRSPHCPYRDALSVRDRISDETAKRNLRTDYGWLMGTVRYY